MQKNKSKRVRFKGFHGIDLRESKNGNESIYDINNLRVCNDGSLKKRYGYERVIQGSSDIRDIWSGTINGEFICVYVSSNYVYSLDIKTGSTSIIRSINSSQGPTQFFFYKDTLFLSDTSDIYKIFPYTYNRPIGYVPLYGKDWPTSFYGEVNEPLNLLNSYARISYLVPENYTAMLPTKFPVKEVLYVYKNDSLLSSEQYEYDSRLKVISIENIKPGDRFLVGLEFDITYSKNALLSLPYVSVFGGVNNSRLFFWSPDDSVIFPSAYVSPTALKEAEKLFPNCSDLYFPEDHNFIVGEGRYHIRGMARHYDRLLVFTEGDTWMANTALTGSESFPLMNINTSLGCASVLGAVTSKNSPFTVGKRDILQWNSDTDELNECNAFSISHPIKEKLSPDFFGEAVVYRDEYRNEIWFHNPNVSGDIWIYNVDRKAWVRFSEIYATKFFDYDGEVGFVYQGSIYKFSSSMLFDYGQLTGGREIEASITTGRLNFDSTDPKKLSSFFIDADTNWADLNIKFITDQNEEISVVLSSQQAQVPRSKRLHSGRFFFLEKVVLSSSQSAIPQIRSLEIYAR